METNFCHACLCYAVLDPNYDGIMFSTKLNKMLNEKMMSYLRSDLIQINKLENYHFLILSSVHLAKTSSYRFVSEADACYIKR